MNFAPREREIDFFFLPCPTEITSLGSRSLFREVIQINGSRSVLPQLEIRFTAEINLTEATTGSAAFQRSKAKAMTVLKL
ncbi:MAG: hypothetical protein J0H48_08645 [Nitrosospira multiformis]|nr:hypothetical protein [Nitrosospira multiformis]